MECVIFAPLEVWQSWSIAPVLKTGVPKGTGGSNPSASASKALVLTSAFFVHWNGRFSAPLCKTRRIFDTMRTLLTFGANRPKACSFHSARFSAYLNVHLLTIWMILGALGCEQQVNAQEHFRADALVQRLPDASAYIEVQTRWTSRFSTAADSLTITVLAIKDDQVVSFAKDNVLARPALQDTTVLEHVHVRRLEVPDGPVRIEWSVDLGETPLWLHNMNVRVPIGGVPEFTDVIVVSTHAKASQRSQQDMVHSGLEMIPLVGRSIPTTALAATFYVELHGIEEIVGKDSLFLLTYGWANSKGEWEPSATAYARKSASKIVPIFESLPCSPSLPAVERPVLKLEARTKEGQVLVSRDIELGQRNSTHVEGSDEGNPEGHAATSKRLPLSTLFDFETASSLSRHLIDHLAVATTNEQNTIQHVLIPNEDVDQMRQYITGFWIERGQTEMEALALHQDYMARIKHVDEQYGDCKKGQGSLTEMGNIYLRFGKPNTIVKRHHETDYYPYEIWHYHKAGRFNNKRFLFYAPHVVGECFELLHSDMLGERQNEDWLLQLRSRENTIRVSQSMENRLNPRDTFSREEPEDLFFNPR